MTAPRSEPTPRPTAGRRCQPGKPGADPLGAKGICDGAWQQPRNEIPPGRQHLKQSPLRCRHGWQHHERPGTGRPAGSYLSYCYHLLYAGRVLGEQVDGRCLRRESPERVTTNRAALSISKVRPARAFTRRHATEETVSGSRSQEAVSLFRAQEQRDHRRMSSWSRNSQRLPRSSNHGNHCKASSFQSWPLARVEHRGAAR